MKSIVWTLVALSVVPSFTFAQSKTQVTSAQCLLGAGMAYATARGRDLGMPMSAFMSGNRGFQKNTGSDADMNDVDRLTRAVYADVKETPEQVFNTMFQTCMAHPDWVEGQK